MCFYTKGANIEGEANSMDIFMFINRNMKMSIEFFFQFLVKADLEFPSVSRLFRCQSPGCETVL